MTCCALPRSRSPRFSRSLRPAAADTAVDLQLVLAVDASGSVNQTRFELQRQGYAAAFRDRRVIEAIAAGAHGRVAVAMVQWTGPTLHVIVVDWTLVHDKASGNALADAIAAVPRQLFGGGTSLSGAIDFAMTMLPRGSFRGDRRVIDISGDGSNNRGRPAADARDEAVKQGVIINGLPILAVEPGLDDWYRDNVIGGPGLVPRRGAEFRRFRRRDRAEAVERDRRPRAAVRSRHGQACPGHPRARGKLAGASASCRCRAVLRASRRCGGSAR